MMKHHKRSLNVLILLAGFVFILSKCINPVEGKDPRGKAFAGAATCRQCHQAIYDSFLGTAHYHATSVANAQNILGNFSPGINTFNYDSITKLVMEKRDSGWFQVLYEMGQEKKAYRFDILFGRHHAQTSLYWQNDKLYELPVSHYTGLNAWATSPGFSVNKPHFQRLVNSDCLDCHSSNLAIKSTNINSDASYDPKSLLVGIDCERCHGPALDHVNFHLQNPNATTAAFLVKNSLLLPQQKLDACAICHSGNDKMKIQSRFEFIMGDSLGYFFMPFGGSTGGLDVHGNQYNLLMQSKCFNINTMTCGTCHDPHKDADQDTRFYSRKCMTCHEPDKADFCPKYARLGESIKSNCIDCHMPKRPSNAISFQMQQSSSSSAYLLRTHRIAIYSDSLDKLHKKMNLIN
ncbi:MAG: multiheme c-type cytochrome [Ferruginibacter sp.]